MKFSQNRLLDLLFGCVFTAGLLASLALIPIGFARHHWICDLFTHFRVQFALVLLLAAVLLLFSARKKFSFFFLGVMCLYLIEIVPFYFSASSPTRGNLFKVVLTNVNSSTGNPKQVLAYLQSTDADLIVIQEFSSRWREVSDALRPTYPHQQIESRSDNFGMAILSKGPLLTDEVFYFSDGQRPSLSAEIQLGKKRLFLLATHPMPPVGAENTQERNRQLQEIAAFLADTAGPMLLLGDLNTSPWSPAFKDLLRISRLKNSMKGFGIQPTWPTHIFPLWTPLDHLLYSDGITVTDRRTGPNIGSDHFPLEVTLQLP